MNEVYELFLDLDADEGQIEFPIVYCNAQGGPSGPRPSTTLDGRPCGRCSRLWSTTSRPPVTPRRTPAAGARHQPRRLAVRRPASSSVGSTTGQSAPGAPIAWCRAGAAGVSSRRAIFSNLYVTEALDRVEADGSRAGRQYVAVAGLDEVAVIAEVASRRRRPAPAAGRSRSTSRRLSMTVGINTSPLAGLDGIEPDRAPGRRAASTPSSSATSPCRVLNTAASRHVGGAGARRAPARGAGRDDAAGKSFELTVGKPQVVTREVNGKLHEPVERLTVDVSRGLRRRRSRSCSRCARGASSRWSTTARVGSGSTSACRHTA